MDAGASGVSGPVLCECVCVHYDLCVRDGVRCIDEILCVWTWDCVSETVWACAHVSVSMGLRSNMCV